MCKYVCFIYGLKMVVAVAVAVAVAVVVVVGSMVPPNPDHQ